MLLILISIVLTFFLTNFASETFKEPITMKKILFALSMLTLASQVYSQDNTVVVIRIFEDIVPETRTNRSMALSPIECRYHTLMGTLELSFLSNLGSVTVILDNLTTGETCDYSGNSAVGMMTMPVASNSCYTMSIITESGRSFRASFLTSDVYEDE